MWQYSENILLRRQTFDAITLNGSSFSRAVTYCDLHFFDAGVDVKDCIVTRTNDRFVLDDDNLK